MTTGVFRSSMFPPAAGGLPPRDPVLPPDRTRRVGARRVRNPARLVSPGQHLSGLTLTDDARRRDQRTRRRRSRLPGVCDRHGDSLSSYQAWKIADTQLDEDDDRIAAGGIGSAACRRASISSWPNRAIRPRNSTGATATGRTWSARCWTNPTTRTRFHAIAGAAGRGRRGRKQWASTCGLGSFPPAGSPRCFRTRAVQWVRREVFLWFDDNGWTLHRTVTDMKANRVPFDRSPGGHYRLTAWITDPAATPGDPAARLWSSMEIVWTGTSAMSVPLSFTPAGRVSGRLLFEGMAWCGLILPDDFLAGRHDGTHALALGRCRSSRDADGTFVINGIRPGRYVIQGGDQKKDQIWSAKSVIIDGLGRARRAVRD